MSKTIELTFYGTGDEAYEWWEAGLRFYEWMADYQYDTVLRKRLLSWLKRGAAISRKDYIRNLGDPDDPHADKITVEVKQ